MCLLRHTATHWGNPQQMHCNSLQHTRGCQGDSWATYIEMEAAKSCRDGGLQHAATPSRIQRRLLSYPCRDMEVGKPCRDGEDKVIERSRPHSHVQMEAAKSRAGYLAMCLFGMSLHTCISLLYIYSGPIHKSLPHVSGLGRAIAEIRTTAVEHTHIYTYIYVYIFPCCFQENM